jgi:hypothetical protein
VALQHGQAPRAASHGSTQPAWYEWEHGSVVVTSASVGTSSRQTAQSTVGNDASTPPPPTTAPRPRSRSPPRRALRQRPAPFSSTPRQPTSPVQAGCRPPPETVPAEHPPPPRDAAAAGSPLVPALRPAADVPASLSARGRRACRQAPARPASGGRSSHPGLAAPGQAPSPPPRCRSRGSARGGGARRR